MSVGGTPALEQDSIHSLFDKLPLMVVLLITTTTILMFLAFGSLVLPIKAALMSALTLGSTMGILTWMFVDGHGSGLMNYTPQPLMAPMIGLIIAVIWGLSTDYEVFLVSRMVEARERGMSTAEAIRIGTATTGRLITGAALVLAVVAGAFVFSDLVMMKYLAFGLLIALLLDATVVRMFLVPAIMKTARRRLLVGAAWMKRLQERLGLGETELPDERKRPAVREPDEALVGAGAPVAPRAPAAARPDASRRRGRVTRPARRPRIAAGPRGRQAPSGAGTTRIPTHAGARPTSRRPRAVGRQERRQRNAVHQRRPRPPAARQALRPPPPPREDREIESWLGELRGNGRPPSAPPAPGHRPHRRRRPDDRDPGAEARHAAGPPKNQATPSRRPPIPAQREQDPEADREDDTREPADDEPQAPWRRHQRSRICCAAKAGSSRSATPARRRRPRP